MAEKKKNNSSSVAPLVIIAVVLALVIGGGYALYSTSKSPTPTAGGSNTSANGVTSSTPPPAPANAPAGAALGINMMGSPTATVTIEEFADFQCPSCAAAHPVLKELQGLYAGNNKVRFIFRHFPLTMHDKSYDAALAVEAAGTQGQPKFWAMLDQVMTNQQAWSSNPNYKQLWQEYAEKIGLDVAKWQADMNTSRARVDLDLQRGRGMGVSSTPSVYVNNRLVPFKDLNVPTLKALIDSESASSTGSGAAPSASSTPNMALAAPSGDETNSNTKPNTDGVKK